MKFDGRWKLGLGALLAVLAFAYGYGSLTRAVSDIADDVAAVEAEKVDKDVLEEKLNTQNVVIENVRVQVEHNGDTLDQILREIRQQ